LFFEESLLVNDKALYSIRKCDESSREIMGFLPHLGQLVADFVQLSGVELLSHTPFYPTAAQQKKSDG
jgi:hypothetical protein